MWRSHRAEYKLDHCYPEASEFMVPAGGAGNELTVPALIAATYHPSPPPFVVALLRNPTDRLWVAFWTYGQYPGKYGADAEGFRMYFLEQQAMWELCTQHHAGELACLLAP